jgi:hypothetical protein
VTEFCLLWLNLFADLLRFLALGLRSKSSLAAENLFLRKQLAFYKERGIKPRRTSYPTRLTLLWLSHWFDWKSALTVVTPITFIGWHRKGFPAVLAQEMPIWPADPPNRVREPLVGRGTNRKRVATETRPARVAADGSEVSAWSCPGFVECVWEERQGGERCRKHIHHTRPSIGGEWSNRCARGGR